MLGYKLLVLIGCHNVNHIIQYFLKTKADTKVYHNKYNSFNFYYISHLLAVLALQINHVLHNSGLQRKTLLLFFLFFFTINIFFSY